MTGSRRSRVVLGAVVLALGALLVLSTGTTAFGAVGRAGGAGGDEGGTVYVLQGLPGVTVDVEVDGAGIAQGVTSARIVGPLHLPAGRHVVALTVKGRPLVSGTIGVARGASVDVVGHWAAQTPPAPRLVALPDDVAPIDRGKARLVVTHAIAGPPADIAVNGKVLLHAVANGESLNAVVPKGTYTVAADATIGGQVLLAPASLPVTAGTFTRVVAVGAPNTAAGVIVHVVRIPVRGAGPPTAVHTGTGGQAARLFGIPVDPLAILRDLPRLPFVLLAVVFVLLAVAVAVPAPTREPPGDLFVIVPGTRRTPNPGTVFLVALLLGSAGVCGAGARLAGGGPDADRTDAASTDASASAATEVALLRAAPVVRPTPSADPGAAAGPAPVAPVGPAYAVGASPFKPTRLVLPDGRSAPVAAVGLHPDRSLVIPADPLVVGWWTGGSMPGDAFGPIVVAGHVDSASRGLGVLAALPGLRPGQIVSLTARGHAARYRVTSSRLVPQVSLVADGGLFRKDGAAQLVLITCGGPFDPVSRHYADNYVVIAEPV